MTGMILTPVRRRLIALLCGAGILCSASGFLPAAVALVGQMDSDHEVVITSSGEAWEIRFHHIDHARPGRTDGEPATVTNLPDSQADHVMQFSSPGPALAPLPSQPAPDHISKHITAIETEQWNPIAQGCKVTSQPRAPPGKATLPCCLRSVVLLI